MDLPSTAAEWLAQFSDGELTSAQKAAFAEWLRESPTHVRELLELTLLRQDLGALPITEAQLEAWTREARASVNAGVVEAVFNGSAVRIGRSPTFRKLSALAAGLAVVCISALAVWWATQSEAYTTRYGEQRVITLADGSVVSLNTDTQLKVRYTERGRAIELVRGEAYFRVSHDPTRPFEVNARNAAIRALGTQFNVRIAPVETIVSVVDGAVEVRSLIDEPSTSHEDMPGTPAVEPAASPIQLKRGEEARIASQESVPQVQPVSITRAGAWTRGRVEFDSTALQDVLAEFQRYRRLDVRVEDEAIRQLKLTGSFDAHDPESALAYIDSLPEVHVEKTAPDAFVIRQEMK